MDRHMLEQIGFGGIVFTGFLLLIAVLPKWTNGLFVARFPWDFIKHKNDPRFEAERRAGKAYSNFIFKYVPPFFIGFLLILMMAYLF
ncbi:MAG: hypothetical protein ACLRPU_20035 [Enterococcus hulanensis]